MRSIYSPDIEQADHRKVHANLDRQPPVLGLSRVSINPLYKRLLCINLLL